MEKSEYFVPQALLTGDLNVNSCRAAELQSWRYKYENFTILKVVGCVETAIPVVSVIRRSITVQPSSKGSQTIMRKSPITFPNQPRTVFTEQVQQTVVVVVIN